MYTEPTSWRSSWTNNKEICTKLGGSVDIKQLKFFNPVSAKIGMSLNFFKKIIMDYWYSPCVNSCEIRWAASNERF
jgi:hypothetical protein